MEKLSRRDFLKLSAATIGETSLVSAFHYNNSFLASFLAPNPEFLMTYRTHISLDGDWQFQIDPENHPDWQSITSWRTASVPLPWQAQFDDLRQYRGVAWYRRQFHLDEAPSGSAILHFGAVDYHATVWLNGQPVGEHEGGYLPFEFDLGPLLQAGSNEVVVK